MMTSTAADGSTTTMPAAGGEQPAEGDSGASGLVVPAAVALFACAGGVAALLA